MKGKIFNAQQVQSMISGNMTIFREVIKPYPILSDDKSYWEFEGVRWAGEKSSYAKNFGDNARPEMPDLCPYQVGQKIFCKESFSYSENEWCDKTVFYKASHGDRIQHTFSVSKREKKWRSPMIMQEYDSRLTLQIKEVRVERLADISEEDAIAEGISKLYSEEELKQILRDYPNHTNGWKNYLWHGLIGKEITAKQSDRWENQYSNAKSAKDSFASLWNATHKKPEENFEADPWVWVLEFKVI